jgi:hypothetical protein
MKSDRSTTKASFVEGITNQFQALKNYLIGDAGQIWRTDSVAYQENIAPGIRKTSLGILFGHYYSINPNPTNEDSQKEFEYNIGDLLNELDNQPHGRAAYDPISRLSGGTPVLADTSPRAMIVRRLLMGYFRNLQNITDITRSTLHPMIKDNDNINTLITTKNIRKIVFNIMARAFFKLDELPSETNETLLLLSNQGFNLKHILFPQFSMLDPAYREAKYKYNELNKQFLEKQVHVIFDIFQSNEPLHDGKNLLVDIIINIIKEENPSIRNDISKLKRLLQNLDEQEIWHYLEHDSMQPIFAYLIVADNIANTIARCLKELFNPDSDMARWLTNNMKWYVLSSYDNDKNLSELSINAIKKLESLDKLYQYYLNVANSKLFIHRFTEHPITLKNKNNDNNITIPAHSFIRFNLGRATNRAPCFSSQRSILFSPANHKRTCPGFRVAEVLFKTIVLEFLIAKNKHEQENISNSTLHLLFPSFKYKHVVGDYTLKMKRDKRQSRLIQLMIMSKGQIKGRMLLSLCIAEQLCTTIEEKGSIYPLAERMKLDVEAADKFEAILQSKHTM